LAARLMMTMIVVGEVKVTKYDTFFFLFLSFAAFMGGLAMD
jgi:hypothetical protein